MRILDTRLLSSTFFRAYVSDLESISVAIKDQGRCVQPSKGYIALAPVPMSRPVTFRSGSYVSEYDSEEVSSRSLSQRM